MDLFSGTKSGDQMILSEEETHHLRVLRLITGDEILVTEGLGFIYHCKISEVKKSNCIAIILSEQSLPAPLVKLHLAIAPVKSMDRMEWLVEKSVEAGIEQFSFLNCKHSERREIKTSRLMKVAISAMKQSHKAHLPVFSEMISFEKFISEKYDGQKLICSLEAKAGSLNTIHTGTSATFLIGPEGDFSNEEYEKAKENNFVPVSLSPFRLRTETAALSACFYFNFLRNKSF